MEVVFEVVIAGACVAYVLGLARMFWGLGKLQVPPGGFPGSDDGTYPEAVVLVAARNEEDGIAACLEALVGQDYPAAFRILVLNDGSTDRTEAIARRFAHAHQQVEVVNVSPALDGTAPKKHALLTGLDRSEEPLVFVTDADCTVRPGWMRALADHFEPHVGLVTGAVFLPEAPGLLARMRNLDFAAYTFCSAGAMASGWPLIATAMNLAYRREAFLEAGGFGEHAGVLSGDDDLMLHTMVGKTAWKAAFAYGPESEVTTQPPGSLGDFANQRMRWASKGFRYPPVMTLFLIAAFDLYAGILVGLPLVLLGLWHSAVPLAAFAVKLVADALVVGRGARRFQRQSLLTAFLPAEVFHLPYILLATMGGMMGLFRWKGRR